VSQLRICVVIPSYNESDTIGSLVKGVLGKNLDVLVIDDGSTDQTRAIAKGAGAEVLTNKQNEGKGASLNKGFRYAIDKNYDAVITMDGDGQHSPEDLPKFAEALKHSSADIIAGNRMSSSQGMPIIRWLTNKFMSYIISKVCKQYIPDSQCGFRLIKKNVLKKLNLVSANYEIESETLIDAYRKGFKIESIPVQTIYAEQVSRINPLIDTIRFFRYITKVSSKE